MRAIVGPVVSDIPEGTDVKLAKRIPIAPSRRRERAGGRETLIAGQRFHDFGRPACASPWPGWWTSRAPARETPARQWW